MNQRRRSSSTAHNASVGEQADPLAVDLDERPSQRRAGGVSDADPDVARSLAAQFEPVAPDEGIDRVLTVDCARPPDTRVEALLAHLDTAPEPST